MSGITALCTGCTHAQRRFRSTTPRLWCQRLHAQATARCIHYRTKRSAIAIALDYLKRTSIK